MTHLPKQIKPLLALALVALLTLVGVLLLRPAPLMRLEATHFITGEQFSLAMPGLFGAPAGGSHSYFTTDLTLEEMLAQCQKAGFPTEILGDSALIWGQNSPYLLYPVSRRKISGFEPGHSWLFFDAKLDLQTDDGDVMPLAFPFHLTHGDTALCPPDLEPAQPGKRYQTSSSPEDFLHFYEILGLYTLEPTPDGFALTSYTIDGPKARSKFPIGFHFAEGELWLTIG